MVKKPAKKSPATNASGSRPAAKSAALSKTTPAAGGLDFNHQQRLLNVFSEAFGHLISADNFTDTLQEIKQTLFQRDFSAAFSKEEYLEAYAARWSPTRALGYASVLSSIKDHLDQILSNGGQELTAKCDAQGPSMSGDCGSLPTESPRSLKMISIGGCAAEQVAFASYINHSSIRGHLSLVDSAPWNQVVSSLQARLTSPPQLSKYASAAAKASNKALVEPSHLTVDFKQCDVLQLGEEQINGLLGNEPLLLTVFFTLNELYTQGGIGKTTNLLGALGQCLPSKSLLLVVDSPGSYSEATVGKSKKKYPMQWLLDHTLLETPMKGCAWEKLESNDSVWFRLPEGLNYPMQLENMRYQLHLYRVGKK